MKMVDVEDESDVCGVWCWAGMVAGMKGGNKKTGGNITIAVAELQLNLIAAPTIAIKFNCCTTIAIRKERKNLPAK